MASARVRLAAGVVVLAISGTAIAVAVLAGRAPAPRAALGAPHFVDETRSSGLDHTYSGGFAFATGGGVAAFDCNDDGKSELYVAGGERPGALFRNDSPPGGSLRFARVPDAATDLKAVTGAYPLDIDGDGKDELFIGHGLWTAKGERKWTHDGKLQDHVDALAVGNFTDDPKAPPRVYWATSDEGFIMLDLDGNVLKRIPATRALDIATGRAVE
jgi:hypothetical protein